MKKERRQFSAQDKVQILRRHLVDKIPVSDLCDELRIQPAQFYHWQQQFFENGAAAFAKPGRQKRDLQAERIAALEQRLVQKNEVVAELLQEHVQLKKEIGGL